MRDRSTTSHDRKREQAATAPKKRSPVPATRHGFRVARPSREAIVGRPSELSSLSAALRPSGLAGLTPPHAASGRHLRDSRHALSDGHAFTKRRREDSVALPKKNAWWVHALAR